MKKAYRFLVMIIILLGWSCQEQVIGQSVPDAVQTSFEKKYPNEDGPDWEVDSHGNYESHFKMNGIKYRADFRPDGQWIETETSIDKKDLPKAIRNAIEKKYNGEISEVEKVDHHSKGIFYDVEFKRKGKNKDIEFRADGTVIN